LFSTLIADADGLYDPTTYNDRLLLGLKGTMSEAELHILKQRMLEGKRAKARRGELALALPMGYVRHPSGEVIKDPDEQARAAIESVFEQFERCATINGVLRHLVDQELRLPYRVRSGARKGALEWRRPNRVTLSNLLHNPAYAGAYVYGRRPTDPRRVKPGRPTTGRTVAPPSQWQVVLKDRLPAYISWERFEHNLRQLQANTAQGVGVERSGPSLLSGLLLCGRCGLRMATQYTNNGTGLRYVCSRMLTDYGEPLCQSLSGAPLDAHIRQLLFAALEPAALQISLQVAEDLEAQRAQRHKQWSQRLERAAFEAERAERQYQAVEPENRLVARTLEQRWEAALAARAALNADYERFVATEPKALSETERECIRRLATDIPALWQAPSTSDAERQAIVRQLVDRVIVKVLGESEQVNVEVHWAGGHRTASQIVRPVARLEQLSYYGELQARVLALHEQGHAAQQIARALNDEGWRPAKRRDTFNAAMVRDLLTRQGLRSGTAKQCHSAGLAHDADEWLLADLALALGMPAVTLFSWIRRGWVQARKCTHNGHPLWLIRADEAELGRLREQRQAPPRRIYPAPIDPAPPAVSRG
jgi:hypothetical protein